MPVLKHPDPGSSSLEPVLPAASGDGSLPCAELEALARSAALEWVSRVTAELRGQSRAVAGGWPGTISQVRALLATRRQNAPAASALQSASLEQVAKRAYALARRHWLENRDILRDEEPEEE